MTGHTHPVITIRLLLRLPKKNITIKEVIGLTLTSSFDH
ncbi:hypothetical protein CPC197_0862 [Chlamydia psittaci C1/97]|nr:hypothetical protein CPC197_0862 [Chlamydia psittaci C1/97]